MSINFGKKSTAEKMQDAGILPEQENNQTTAQTQAETENQPKSFNNKPTAPRIEKIELDEATIDTIIAKKNLVEKMANSSFDWKEKYKKQLMHLTIDTGVAMEEYLRKWAVEGLKKKLKELGQEFKE